VILLDEIEKAHRDVFNVLLQVLDDGRLTDGHGRTVDFKNTLIAMTSNIGSEHIQRLFETGHEATQPRSHEGKPYRDETTSRSGAPPLPGVGDGGPLDIEIEMKVKEALKAHFRPEFLNRIDETIIFQQLTREDLVRIAEIQIKHLQQRLAARDMTLTLTDQAKERLAKKGFDPAYGARPLKRLIQQEIENPLAKRILNGEFAPGDKIVVDASGEVLTFQKLGH